MHATPRASLTALLTLTAALAFGCQPIDAGDNPEPGPDGPNPPAAEAGEWPGGSADDWTDEVGGLRHHEEPGHVDDGWGEEGPGEPMAGDGAWDEGGDWDEGGAAGGGGAGGGGGGAPPPEPAPEPAPEPEGFPGGEGEGEGDPERPGDAGAPALEGGAIDDNGDFVAYLEYAAQSLDIIGDDPAVHWADVARRHLIKVVDAEGRRVPDATVAIRTPDGQPVAWGRTRADGRFAFYPRAYGPDIARYDVTATQGELVGRGEVSDNDAVRIALDGVPEPAALQIDVAFVIDATGSMMEEIDRIKQTISDIAARVADDESAPDLRFGLVAYRDRGDDFVTRTVDFTDDIEAFQGVINGLQANGGGDFPEALNEAMYAAMRRLDWRRDATLRLAFVVADAPAHHYEQQSYVYLDGMLDAATMGVKLFPVASGGSDPVAEFQFRQLAQFTLGQFVFITEGGGSPQGSGGSDYDVDPADFDVERLDDLIVRLITEEMTAWLARAAD